MSRRWVFRWVMVVAVVVLCEGWSVTRGQESGEKPALVRAGGYFFAPTHHVHRFTCLGACSAFVHSDGTFDVHYVDQSGNEIPPEQALKRNGAMATQAK